MDERLSYALTHPLPWWWANATATLPAAGFRDGNGVCCDGLVLAVEVRRNHAVVPAWNVAYTLETVDGPLVAVLGPTEHDPAGLPQVGDRVAVGGRVDVRGGRAVLNVASLRVVVAAGRRMSA